MMPKLPMEMQILILTYVFHSTTASESNLANLRVPWPLTFPESPTDNFPFAAIFLSHSTGASQLPGIGTAARDAPETASLPVQRIGEIKDALILRAALSAALPAWRRALCSIPRLWSRIAVPLDERTWGNDVLDAVQEALVLSRKQYLSILITHNPAENGVTGASEEGQDGGEAERARALQIMTLLEPHIARCMYLRVCTLYPAALPVPMIDFRGEASLLNQLHLRSALSTPSAAFIAPQDVRTLNVPLMYELTMDVHTFCATYLRQPEALPAVHTLTLYGGLDGSSAKHEAANDPATSVRTLLECIAQMPILFTLSLTGVHLSVGQDGDVQGGRTLPRYMRRLRCANLPVAVLEELLSLTMVNDVNGNLDEEEEDLIPLQLEIVQCALPRSPLVLDYNRIDLVGIAASEDIATFLEHAVWCDELMVRDCPAFPLDKFAKEVSTIPSLHVPGALVQRWLVPQLRYLDINGCTGIEGHMLQDIMLRRQGARAADQAVDQLEEVTLDGQDITIPALLPNPPQLQQLLDGWVNQGA